MEISWGHFVFNTIIGLTALLTIIKMLLDSQETGDGMVATSIIGGGIGIVLFGLYKMWEIKINGYCVLIGICLGVAIALFIFGKQIKNHSGESNSYDP